MGNRFFEKPILNSPYEYPVCHWELDDEGQPTQQIIKRRRRAEFITPIPKPRRRKSSAIDTYWVPGVNNLGTFGRWAFAEFTEVYQIESDFEAKVEAEFNKMIEQLSTNKG